MTNHTRKNKNNLFYYYYTVVSSSLPPDLISQIISLKAMIILTEFSFLQTVFVTRRDGRNIKFLKISNFSKHGIIF